MIYNLQNIIPLGVLDYGIYPNKDRRPIIYLYYRPNGDLMMYRTKDEIEVNLTNNSSYDTNILFRVTDKDSIFDNVFFCFVFCFFVFFVIYSASAFFCSLL